jgi:hypothetical protein
MKDENECRTHAGPAADDPELLNYAGPLTSRKQQLKAARRQRAARRGPSTSGCSRANVSSGRAIAGRRGARRGEIRFGETDSEE